MIIGFSKSAHVWIITMVFHLLVNLHIKSQNVPKKFILLAAEENLVYRQKQNVRKCISNSEKSMFPFHIYILLHRLQVFMETDTRPSVNLNEGASNVQVMFDPNPLNKCCIVHFCKLQMSSNRDNTVLLGEEKEKIMLCFIIRVIVTQRLLGNVSKCGSVEQIYHICGLQNRCNNAFILFWRGSGEEHSLGFCFW